MTLGAKLAAFAAGVTPHDLIRIAHADLVPEPDEELRLRNLFAVASLLVARDGAGSAYIWLTEPNPELRDRSPADLLHEGSPPETVWLAAATPF